MLGDAGAAAAAAAADKEDIGDEGTFAIEAIAILEVDLLNEAGGDEVGSSSAADSGDTPVSCPLLLLRLMLTRFPLDPAPAPAPALPGRFPLRLAGVISITMGDVDRRSLLLLLLLL